jgi:hypothetical protein
MLTGGKANSKPSWIPAPPKTRSNMRSTLLYAITRVITYTVLPTTLNRTTHFPLSHTNYCHLKCALLRNRNQKPVKHEEQVKAMTELWHSIVEYHDVYMPGITTNMSEASHSYVLPICAMPFELPKLVCTLPVYGASGQE